VKHGDPALVRHRTTEEIYVYCHCSDRVDVCDRLRGAGYKVQNLYVTNDDFDMTVIARGMRQDKKPTPLEDFLKMKIIDGENKTWGQILLESNEREKRLQQIEREARLIRESVRELSEHPSLTIQVIAKSIAYRCTKILGDPSPLDP
jgi:hypothetical protein